MPPSSLDPAGDDRAVLLQASPVLRSRSGFGSGLGEDTAEAEADETDRDGLY